MPSPCSRARIPATPSAAATPTTVATVPSPGPGCGQRLLRTHNDHRAAVAEESRVRIKIARQGHNHLGRVFRLPPLPAGIQQFRISARSAAADPAAPWRRPPEWRRTRRGSRAPHGNPPRWTGPTAARSPCRYAHPGTCRRKDEPTPCTASFPSGFTGLTFNAKRPLRSGRPVMLRVGCAVAAVQPRQGRDSEVFVRHRLASTIVAVRRCVLDRPHPPKVKPSADAHYSARAASLAAIWAAYSAARILCCSSCAARWPALGR